MQRSHLAIFFFCFFFLALSYVFCLPIHYLMFFWVSKVSKNDQKMFHQKIYLRKRSYGNNWLFLSWTCFSKKRKHLSMNNHFLSLLILLMSIKIKLKETWGHRKSYKCIKCSKGNRKFISKKLLKNANKGSYIKYAGGGSGRRRVLFGLWIILGICWWAMMKYFSKFFWATKYFLMFYFRNFIF